MPQKNSHLIAGVSFGIPSALIETIGVILGLYGAGASKNIIVAGVIASIVADALADSVSVHISAEARRENETWKTGLWTFLTQLCFDMTFVIPILFLHEKTAILVDIIWGLTVLAILSFYIARVQNSKPSKVILKNIAAVLLVIVISYYIGVSVNELI